MKKLFAEFLKAEAQDDGTIKVYGIASSEAVDSDGEVIKSSAIKAAIPDYMKFGAVREMHQPMAAGTALEVSVEEDGTTKFAAHIVDPVAVKKVQAGVYKGFSIGGRVTKRDEKNATVITGIKLVEVSLVDRPANPDAVMTCFKVEDGGDEPAAPAPAAETPPAVDPVAEPAAKADDPQALRKAAIDGLAALINKGDLTPAEVLAAAQAELAKRAAGPRAKVVPKALKKGMDSLSMLIGLIQQIGWLASCAEDEASWEGDDSPLPAQLRDWLAQGITLLHAMTEEETGELMAALTPKAETVETTKAEQPGDALKAALTEDLTKVATDAATALLTSELAKRDTLIDTLAKRLAALEAQPAPGKGVLKVVSKGDDVTPAASGPRVDPVKKSDGTVDETATLIKSIHASGGKPLRI